MTISSKTGRYTDKEMECDIEFFLVDLSWLTIRLAVGILTENWLQDFENIDKLRN